METAGEERVRATNGLRQLEDAAILLENASKEQAPEKVSPGFPGRVSGILNGFTAISSREDAERLLATGVSMWNSVIAFEDCEMEQKAMEALVKIRHVSADCMYMSTTVLGGISARYNIDDLSLLKFYTACGQKYATDLCDMEMAEVCLSKAAEFVDSAVKETRSGEGDQKVLSRALFDLMLGQAECAWEKGENDEAERFVSEARQHLKDLPDEHEFLASVEYNFGLFTYQAKETERALKWLRRSMETRDGTANHRRDLAKQAKTARLAGVCLLALQEYEEAWQMMKSAEEMSHDPVGSYLLLKLSVITKHPQALDLLVQTVNDLETNLDVCVASISLFGDAQRLSDAATGFDALFERFKDDSEAIVCTVGPRYFETLSALGKVERSLQVLDVCCSSIHKLKLSGDGGEDGEGEDHRGGKAETMQATQFSKWSALLLAAGSSQADRKDFKSATTLLDRALRLAKQSAAQNHFVEAISSTKKAKETSSNVVLDNEAAVCRLTASCALCSLDGMTSVSPVSFDRAAAPEDGSDSFRPLDLALVHAKRAKELEPNDFAPRLLLFRVFLVAKKYSEAAAELRVASSEIHAFDPGALAEAACAARDVGSTESVLAALGCILSMDPAELTRKLTSLSGSPPKGFFGTILLSCVNIMLGSNEKVAQNGPSEVENASPERTAENGKKAGQLQQVLQLGLRGIKSIGLDVAFDEQKENISESISYLMDVAWNAGRNAGIQTEHMLWESYFELCYEFSMLLPPSASVLQTRRISKLMCASANIENPASKEDDYRRAKTQVQDARSVSLTLREMSGTASDDPMQGILLVLEARSCVGFCDLDALACVVEMALECAGLTAGVLEQMAAVCHNYRDSQNRRSSEVRVRCADLTAALLSKASDVRLQESQLDLAALSLTMRELLGIEVSRGSTASRAYNVFLKATGVVLENEQDFPPDERRWLVAIGWDRAQMYSRVGQPAEARRWGEGVRQLTDGCVALSSYRPRLEAFLAKLDTFT